MFYYSVTVSRQTLAPILFNFCSIFEYPRSIWYVFPISVTPSAINPAITNATDSIYQFAASLNNNSISGTANNDSTAKAVSIPAFASGGVVGDGQLFIANEGGAELIGSDGSGNTAIVNNEQIISAVVTGVRQAVLEAGMSIADRVAESSGGGGDTVIEIDSVEIARAANRGNKKIGRRENHNVTFA